MATPPRTKADIVREYLLKFTNLGPSELIELILSDHPGLRLRPQEVSTIKGKLKKDGKWPGPTTTSPPIEPAQDVLVQPSSFAEKLLDLKAAAEAVGGCEEAKKLLDIIR